MKVDDKTKREQLLNEIRGLIAADGCINLVHWHLGLLLNIFLKISINACFVLSKTNPNLEFCQSFC